eukprot:4514425-Amphidinium_carterae.1
MVHHQTPDLTALTLETVLFETWGIHEASASAAGILVLYARIQSYLPEQLCIVLSTVVTQHINCTTRLTRFDQVSS